MERKIKERIELVRSMETVARAVNDEEVFESWLLCGVADGDIDEDTTDEDLEWYAEEENFKDLMDVFLRMMARAKKSGGLYCGDVTSSEG